MNPRFLAGMVLGASLLGGVASAQNKPFIAEFEAHNDLNAGALWRNDRPNNNNQRGAGAEHQSVTILGNKHVIVVATASYTDVTPLIAGAGLSSLQAGVLEPKDGNPGVQAQGNRVEGLCTSYDLDATKGLVKTNMAYFTDNKSPDWQNMHKPHVQPINGGAAALVLYGHDPNGNRTRVYGKVLGPNCELLSAQTQLFADNNDDYGGIYDSADTVYSDAGGSTQICGGNIGNGNGTDDAHAFCVTTKATGQAGAAAYTVAPQFIISIEANEERSRATTQKTPFADRMLFCLSAGNDQPTDSVRCGLVNTAPGVANNARLVWRQTIAQRKGNIHYTTPSLVSVPGADGKPSDKYILSYVKVDTSNRQGRSKARTAIQTVPIQITADKGVTLLDTPKEGLFGIADGSHPGMTAGTYGPDNRPVAFLFANSITDGGTATAKIIGLTADNKIEPIRALNWAGASSGGYTSLWYGHNPNTPQGRSYPPTSIAIDNPGFGTAGGFQPEVKKLLLVANVYHNDHAGQCGAGDPNKGTNNGTCGGKNALGLSLVPIAANAASTTTPASPSDPTPSDPTRPTDGDGDGSNNNGSDPGTTLGGCSATGGAGAGSLLLLGLAAVVIRRRRAR